MRREHVHVPLVNSSLDVVFIGLAITSSWGNGHATTYRSLLKGLHARGHRVLFLEQDQPWYAAHRDLAESARWETALYTDLEDLRRRFATRVRRADAVIVGSYVDGGQAICDWVLETATGVRAFYDIDTPVTLRGVRDDTCPYLAAKHIGAFDLFLSFTGGPTLQVLRREFGGKHVRPLYCSVDTDEYQPQSCVPTAALGYMGTYSRDRQPALEQFLNEPARALSRQRFIVVGAQYPDTLAWPPNVERCQHLPPSDHPHFYARQRFTLNLTRADMRRAGHSPSVRLFEAAACNTPIISDEWPGLEDFFTPSEEILIARSGLDVCEWLSSFTEKSRLEMAARARQRVLATHSGLHRATQLEDYIQQLGSQDAYARSACAR
jgi:spore maturation protein CgeB